VRGFSRRAFVLFVSPTAPITLTHRDDAFARPAIAPVAPQTKGAKVPTENAGSRRRKENALLIADPARFQEVVRDHWGLKHLSTGFLMCSSAKI
jgi:hypothetical protein